MSFVHLHCHSHYSLLKALPKVDELVAEAVHQKMPALALTDNGVLYGAIEFYEACKAAGIKPIIGCELYTPGHLTVLAENFTGYKNLMRLVSRAALDGLTDGLPVVSEDMLREFHDGLICLSGCIHGEISGLIRAGEISKAQNRALELQNLFGAENFFLELQDHLDIEGQFAVNEALQKISQATNIPLVVTRDVHYLHEEDAEACDIMECIGLGTTVGEHRPQSLVDIDRSFGKVAQIESRWRHVPEALANTGKIAERVNIEIPLNVWHFPPIEIPAGKTADEELRDQSYAGIAELIPEITAEIRERLDYELSVIAKKGYAPYFLAVADYIKWARERGIVTTTRGSAAGSLVSYSIGIVAVNPLYFKLPFERFLNLFRPSPPDVDGDFADDRRDEVIAYVTEKYGKDKVAQIITFGTMMARSSVRDAGRALGMSYGLCDQVAKLIPFGSQGFGMTIKRAMKESPDLKKLYDEQEHIKKLLDVAQKIEGCARHTSIHAAGVVISPEPLTEFTPVQYEVGGTRLTTQYEMGAVEKAGILKMDFLGIRNLSILGNAVKLLRELYNVEIDLQKIPWDDAKTYAMLARGETGGTFQLGGAGMTRYLKELKPTNIFDIMAMVALFRPGPMESIPEYIRRKHNPELVTYLDERLKKILDQSLGILVYQDDVMLAAIELAGYSWEEADKFRKAMGKKIPEEMAKQKTKFFAGCLQGGMSAEKVETLWQLIEPFAAYGFGRAHAASYAVVAYQTAYLKANYPAAYMCSVLSAESDDIEKVAEIVHECERMGVQVLPPDVNESDVKFSVRKNAEGAEYIRFGLSAVKNIGTHITGVIIAERMAHGTYKSLEDFLTRVHDKDLNKKTIDSLAKCGALDAWGDRALFLANTERILNFARSITAELESNQSSLFGGAVGENSVLELTATPPASKAEKLSWEKELIGIYFSSHPFAEFSRVLNGVYTEITAVDLEAPGAWVTLCGLVSSTKKKWTKNRDAMMNVVLEDMSGSLELLVFPKTFAKTEAVWEEGACVCVIGKRSAEPGDNKIFVEKAERLQEENISATRERLERMKVASGGRINASAASAPTPVPTIPKPAAEFVTIILPDTCSMEQKNELKQILTAAPGACAVYLQVSVNGVVRTIETGMSVVWGPDLSEKIITLLGPESTRYSAPHLTASF